MARRGLGAAATAKNQLITLADLYKAAGLPEYQVGLTYLVGGIIGGLGTTVAWTVGQARMSPFTVRETMTISAMGLRVAGVAAGSKFKFAIYATDSTGRPSGAPVLTSGDLSGAAAGIIDATLSYQFSPGVYWIMANIDTTGQTFHSFPAAHIYHQIFMGSATKTTIAAGFYYSYTLAYATAWPTSPVPVETPSSNAWCPVPHFTLASIP